MLMKNYVLKKYICVLLLIVLMINTFLLPCVRVLANPSEEEELSGETAAPELELKAGVENCLDDTLPVTAGQQNLIESEVINSIDADIRQIIREDFCDDWETIEVSNAEELMEVAHNCVLDSWSMNKIISITCDISLDGTDFSGIPIFSGIWDGGGHRISGVDIQSGRSYSGFFGIIQEDAIIMDFHLEGNVTENKDVCCEIGGIAACNKGIIINSSFSGEVSGCDYIGGIVGINDIQGQIYDCETNGTITGRHYVGGIAGLNTGNINRCTNNAEVNNLFVDAPNEIINTDSSINILNYLDQISSEDDLADIYSYVYDIGGICGVSYGVVANSVNNAGVGYQFFGSNVGGVVGRQSGYIYKCINNGKVLGESNVGGIVGFAEPYVVIDMDSDTGVKLKKSIEDLHDLINKTLEDYDDSSDVISTRLSIIQQFTGGAIDDTSYIINATGNYANSVSASANSLMNKTNEIAGQINVTRDNLSELSRTIREKSYSDILSDGSYESNNLAKSKDIEISDATFPTLDQNYFMRISSLNGNLKAVNDNMGLLINEYNEADDRLVADLMDVNNQFEQVLILYSEAFEKVINKDIEDIYTDESVKESETSIDGTVNKCTNNAEIKGKYNVGGIAGKMDVSTDVENYEKILGVSSIIKGDSYVTKCVIRYSDNNSNITGTKTNIGGICGKSTTGLIYKCSSYGDIDALNCDFVGGISGYSSGYISDCASRGNIYGTEYAGGIAGEGYNILNSISLVSIIGCTDWYGAIAGFVPKDALVRNNYYISDDLAGINRVSYEMKAQATSIGELTELENVFIPDDFDKVRIQFVVDNEEKTVIKTEYIPYGSSVKKEDYPSVDAPEGYYIKWDMDSIDGATLDTRVTALFCPYVKSLSGPDIEGLHQSYIVVDGLFNEKDSLDVQLDNEFKKDQNGEYMVGCCTLLIPDDGQDIHTVRYYIGNDKKHIDDYYKVYIQNDETWVLSANSYIFGDYLVFPVSGNEVTFKVCWTGYETYVLLYVILPISILVLFFIMVVAVVIVAIIKRRSITDVLRAVVRRISKKSKQRQALFYHAKEDKEGDEREGQDWRDITKEWNIIPEQMVIHELELKIDNIEKYKEIIDETVEDVILNTKAKIAFEEIFVNICNYSSASYVRFYCGIVQGDTVIAFWDNGIGFNPTMDYKDEEIMVKHIDSNMGIGLVRKLSSQWIYTRINRENCNFIRICK